MITVNGARLWSTLNEMAQLGATPAGGVTRLALSEEDRQARNLLRQWAREAGFPCEVDSMGNMFIRRCGKHSHLPPVLTGSHVDSQPLGGRYDGIYGVLAGLEALRTLNDRGIATERDIVLVNWTNEEGARFAPAMLASGVWAGQFSESFALAREDRDGISVGEALEAIGYRGERPAAACPLHACYEVHIEQGPILEEKGVDIGLVHAAMGQRWFNVTLEGFSAHAGTTPMGSRRDALTAFAELALAVEQIGIAHNPDGRATIGMAQVIPGSRNVVPGGVACSVEFRHPQSPALEAMERALHRAAEALAARVSSGQSSMGMSYELDAIAAAVIGGSSLMGGVGRITGTLIGAMILGLIKSGFTFVGVDAYVQDIIKGIIIVAAVTIDMRRNRKKH